MVDAALYAIYIPAGLAVLTLAIWWAAAVPRLALGALFVGLVAGQLIRIPLPGQGGGLLVSDIAVVLTLVVAGFKFFRHPFKHYKLPFDPELRAEGQITNYVLLTFPFLLWSLFTLGVHIPALGVEAAAVAFAYWVRLAVHLLLLPAILVLLWDTKLRRFAHRGFLTTITVLAVLGFTQLALLPRLGGLPGWDPHINRLVSTWLDPNFIGLFFVLAIVYLLFFKKDSSWLRVTSYGILITVLLALVLTQSRSSLTALAVVALVFSPVLLLHAYARVKHQLHIAVAALAAGGTGLAILVLAALLLGGRLPATVLDDPTVSLRLAALTQTWQALAVDTAMLGVGYNAYQFAAQREGFIESFAIHSRAGSDNSLLTLWVTTGITGIVLFALPWAYIGQVAWHTAWHAQKMALLAVPAALLMILAHSQVVNSLLYSHLIITLVVIIGLLLHPNASHA